MDATTAGSRHHRFSRLAPLLILAAGWTGFMVYAYPGYMSFDSAWQFLEARSGHFTDWHPPVMAEMWRLVDQLIPGPLGMLLIQSIAFVIGMYLILTICIPRLPAAVAVVFILLFAPVSTTVAVIWKDSQMTAFLALGTGLLLRPGLRWQIAGILSLALASGMRHNAFTITFPIVVILLAVPASQYRWRRYLIALLVWGGITVIGFLANSALADERKFPWHGSLALFDIVGTIRYSEPLSDAELQSALRGTAAGSETEIQAKAKAVYDPFAGVFPIINRHFLDQPVSASEREAVVHAWTTLVFAHPAAYLRHRLRAYRELLQLSHKENHWVWIGYDQIGGYSHSPNAAQQWLQKWASDLGASWLMRPYGYLLLALLLIPFAYIERDAASLSLLLSGVLSELALFFLAPTPDFRYSIWLVTSALLALSMLFYRRMAGGRRDRQQVADEIVEA